MTLAQKVLIVMMTVHLILMVAGIVMGERDPNSNLIANIYIAAFWLTLHIDRRRA